MLGHIKIVIEVTCSKLLFYLQLFEVFVLVCCTFMNYLYFSEVGVKYKVTSPTLTTLADNLVKSWNQIKLKYRFGNDGWMAHTS